MEIGFRTRKLKSTLEDDALCQKHYGAAMAIKIQRRLAALSAAETLADLWPPNSGPERCHELFKDLSGRFSVDLMQPYRMLFVPVGLEPGREYRDQQERWAAIRSIEILSIEDTHG